MQENRGAEGDVHVDDVLCVMMNEIIELMRRSIIEHIHTTNGSL